jgi:hypothetical protein
MRRASLAIS